MSQGADKKRAETPRARRLTWVDQAIGLGLGAIFVAVLLLTMDMGFARDEGYYFHAAFEYLGWFKGMSWASLSESLSQATIDKHWGYNQEHPVLPKVLFGLSYWLFHESLDWMPASTAMRLPGALFSGLLVTLVYLFSAEAFGRWQGLCAAILTAAMPRPFFHAHMAAFDAPVSTMWFFVMYAHWKGLRSTRWGWATGVIFGLAMSIKHNVFFLPPLLVLHWLITRGASTRSVEVAGRRQIQLPPVPVSFLSMAVLGPLVWFALWPSHWYDTFNRIAWYFSFHLKHVHYFQYYFGQNLYEPPFPVSFPFVISLVTMPPATILAFALGALGLVAVWLRTEGGAGFMAPLRSPIQTRFGELPADPRGTGWWLALGAFVPFAIIAQPSTPIFGGIKHWMPAMPFIAIVASVATVAGARALSLALAPERRRLSAAIVAATIALLSLPALIATAHNHPHGTAFYNVLIGGPRGAANQKMMRQFWGFSGRNGLPFLNRNTPPNAQVFFQNTNRDSVRMYKRDGLLREDIRYSGSMPAGVYGLIHHQMAARSLEIEMWRAYKTRNPAFVADTDGVPVLSIYPNTTRLK